MAAAIIAADDAARAVVLLGEDVWTDVWVSLVAAATLLELAAITYAVAYLVVAHRGDDTYRRRDRPVPRAHLAKEQCNDSVRSQ